MELIGLNEEQKTAVETINGPLLILAGAGSGKTRVITYRIANLVLNYSLPPQNCLAVTFTNKAAEEMRTRCLSLIPPGKGDPFVRTFHSLCLYILRKEGHYLGLKGQFTVYDSDLQESLLKEIIKAKDLDTKDYKPSSIANIFSKAKDSFLTAEDYAKQNKEDPYSEVISSLFLTYEKEKEKRNAVDFGDLILKTVILFRDFPFVLEKYQNLWRYIMVDEYQDTNKIQYHLVKLLAQNHRNICVVGDDDQSIYSWRGADITNILNFNKDYPDAVVVKLEENYRSTKTIINTAAHLIQFNRQRTLKTLRTENGTGRKIQCSVYQNEMEEAEGIIQKIQKGYASSKRYSNYAIFYRTNSQSRYFEEALRKRGIPYKIFGGFRFFDRKEVKDLIAYLSLVVNPVDSTSLLRVLNTPPRGIGETTIKKLLDQTLKDGISLYESLQNPVSGIKKGTAQKCRALAKILENAMLDLGKKRPSEIAYDLLEHSGYRESLENEGNEEAFARLANLNEFINAIRDFEENNPDASLDEYLNSISLLTSEENQPDLTDFVILMTIHNAKGLEFESVFLAGMEDGTFPHFLSLDGPEGIEEERRLAYVAITRAKEELSISLCRFTRKFGEVEARFPSRFLSELPEEYLDGDFAENQFGIRSPIETPLAQNLGRDSRKEESIHAKTGGRGIQVGSRVRHKVYGEGKVISLTGHGDNQKVEVRFGVHVAKKFLLAYTPLELISS